MKRFIVKENAAFRLSVTQEKCARPSDLNSINFIQESFDSTGAVALSSSYNFMLTDSEITTLAKALLND